MQDLGKVSRFWVGMLRAALAVALSGSVLGGQPATVSAAGAASVESAARPEAVASSDATLASLSMILTVPGQGPFPMTLSPSFSANTTQYSTSAGPYSVMPPYITSVAVSATATTAGSAITATSSGGACPGFICPVVGGANYYTVTVTATDLTTTKSYHLVIQREAGSTDPRLASLSVDVGTLSPTFISTTTRYTATVPTSATTVKFSAQTAGSGAGVITATGSAGDCPLVSNAYACPSIVGTTFVTLTSQAEEGTATQNTYISIVRPAGDPRLTQLTVSGGTLVPTFISTTKQYTVNLATQLSSVNIGAQGVAVGFNQAQITVTASTGNCPYVPQNGTYACALENTTTIDVLSTAVDGVTTQTTRITVIRPPFYPFTTMSVSKNNGASGDVTLFPSFISSTMAYTASAASDAYEVNFIFAANAQFITFTASAGSCRKDAGTNYCPLAYGMNVITGTAQTGGIAASTIFRITRQPHTAFAATVRELADGYADRTETCAVDIIGRALCWSQPQYATATATSSVYVVPGLQDVQSVSMGEGFACALLQTGRVKCWGSSSGGFPTLGTGFSTDSSTPVNVMQASSSNYGAVSVPISNVTQISAGRFHTCALVNGGAPTSEVWCWGNPHAIGNGYWAATKVAGITGATSVAAGRYQTCAITASQTYCFGDNDWTSQSIDYLNVGNTVSRTIWTAIRGPGGAGTMGPVDFVTAGWKNTCVVKGGMQYCWGYGRSGIQAYDDYSLGIAALTATLSSTQAALTGVAQTALGKQHACTRTTTGDVYCSGETSYYNAGTGAVVGYTGSWGYYVPRLLPVIAPSYSGIAAGGQFTGAVDIAAWGEADEGGACALRAFGEVFCWGTSRKVPNFGRRELRTPTLVIGPSSLTSMTVSPGTLKPAFYSTTFEYNVTVLTDTTHLTVSAIAEGAGVLYYTSTVGVCVQNVCPVADESIVTVTVSTNTAAQEYGITVKVPQDGASDDASLSGLAIHPGSLHPAFVSSTTSYTAEVPNGTTSMVVTATTNDAGATVVYASSHGACTGSECPIAASGATTITIDVTAADGKTAETYTIVVTVASPAASNDASLSELAMHPGSLTPAFVSTTTRYAATVPNGTTSAVVTATANHAGASVAYASTAGACTGSDCPIAASGITTLTITITAADDATTETYTIVVSVAAPGASTDASLGELTMHPGAPTPAFVSTTMRYTATVPDGTQSVVVTATANDAGASVAYASTAGACGGDDCPIAATGTTTITITITAADGSTTETYTIVVTVAPSTDASLSELVMHPGSLNPAFSSATTRYAATVPDGTTSVVVTPTTNNAGASAAYASTAGACTGSDCPINASGTTTLTITITAADGSSTETYTIVVTVAPPGASTDASLGELALHPGALSPAFATATNSYTATVPNGTSSVVVTATTNDAGASVAYASTAGACAGSDCPINASGTTTITITVTAADGASTETYTIVVTVAPPGLSSDASLGELAMHPGALSPAFASATTAYAATVPDGTSSVLVTATTNDTGASIAYASTAGACTGSDCPINASGTTTLTITITAADGASTETYTIVVTVAPPGASSDASLAGLSVDPGALTPAFAGATTAYAVAVPHEVAVLTVTALVNDAAATVSFAPCEPASASTATCSLVVGVNHITATVTAEDRTTQEYVIVVIRAAPLTTIGLVWPNIGVPEGGMPVTLFGTGFSVATRVRISNTLTNAEVPFTVTGDDRIDFVMPAGVDGTTADITVETEDGGSQTAAQAFRYVAPVQAAFDAATGAVITTANGLTITIPPQGVGGTFVITLTPVPPDVSVPGSLLMHSFRLEALLDGVPLDSLNTPITVELPVDPAIVPSGERPWLYGRRSDGNVWSLVPNQTYDAAARKVQVSLRPMGAYALSASRLRAVWFPQVPTLR